MQNQNHNWEFEVNLAGVPTAGGGVKVVEGYYNGILSAAYIDLGKNPDRMIFKVTLTDPTVKGATRVTSMYIPGRTPSGKDNRMFWRAVLESLGYEPSHLETNLKLSPAAMVNRPCTVYYRPKNPDAIAGSDQWDQLQFLAPGHWQAKKAAFASAPKVRASASTLNASAPATSTPTITASSAGFAPPAVSPQDLMNMAGLPQNK